MRKLYSFKSKLGRFYIVQTQSGRFHPYFDDEALGAYLTPQQAAEAIAGGHTFSIAGGVDTATLGIPDELEQWSVHRSGAD